MIIFSLKSIETFLHDALGFVSSLPNHKMIQHVGFGEKQSKSSYFFCGCKIRLYKPALNSEAPHVSLKIFNFRGKPNVSEI